VVTPRTAVGWHRAGYRLYWKWLSRARQLGGRKPVSKEIRALMFRRLKIQPGGALRIHGELLKLGFHVFGNHGVAMVSASSEKSGSGQAKETHLAGRSLPRYVSQNLLVGKTLVRTTVGRDLGRAPGMLI